MFEKIDQDNLLKRFDSLVREIENLKRDLLRSLTVGVKHREVKPTLFGSIKGGEYYLARQTQRRSGEGTN